MMGMFGVTAALAISIALTATPARADMSCQDFTRAYVLSDNDVLAQAVQIAQPLIDAGREVHAILNPTEPPRRSPLPPTIYLMQLSSDCEALPTDTVDRIVATRLKTMQQQKLAAIEIMKTAGTLPRQAPPESVPTLMGNDTAVLTAAMRDHARHCWPGTGDLDIDQQRVLLKVTIDAAGIARKAEVAGDDTGRMGDPRFRAFAEKAVRAILDPHCSKIPLPDNMLGRVNVMTFRYTN